MLVSKLYGVSHLGALTGVVNTIHFLGAAFWTYMAGVIFDRTGSYQTAFLLLIAAAGIAVLCGLFIAEKRHGAIPVQ